MKNRDLNRLVYHEVCRRAVEAGAPFDDEQKKLLRWALAMGELPENDERYLPKKRTNDR